MIMIALVMACSENGTNQNQHNESPDEQREVVAEKRKPLSLGQRMFIMCEPCHSVKEGEAHKTGPNLHGIFGSPAAAKEGFTYSEALQQSGITWDESHIKNWLAKPMDYIPGTTMAFVGIEKEEQQDALIEYLKEITQ